MSGVIKQIRQFIIGSVAEAKKVTWPTKQQLFGHSLIVVGALIVSIAIIALIDYAFSYLIQTYLLGV